jgi:branched-chain amino acid transport system ATP-binding protein
MTAGLAPVVVTRPMAAVPNQGRAIVLVEGFAALALSIGDRASALRGGAWVYDGACAALRQTRTRCTASISPVCPDLTAASA